MADPAEAEEQRSLEHRTSVYLRISRGLSSPRVRVAVVCVLKVVVYFGVIVIMLRICWLVLHHIRANETMLVNLRDIIEVLSNKIEAQSDFIKAQQHAVMSLLETVERKFELQNKNTQELVQKNIEKVHQLTDQTMKSVQRMTERQAVADGALERKIGKAVVGTGQSILIWALPFLAWPLSLAQSLGEYLRYSR